MGPQRRLWLRRARRGPSSGDPGGDGPQLPVFATTPVEFTTVVSPGPLAATPPGFDLVGPGSAQAADGLPEIAVASQFDGYIRLYRNEDQWDPSPATSLTPIDNGGMSIPGFDIDVFTPLFIPRFTGLTYIHDIEFVEMTPSDGLMLADLVVAIERPIPDPSDPNTTVQVGMIAVFVAELVNNEVGYRFRSSVDVDLPVTGIAFADAEGDGLLDVLAAVSPPDPLLQFMVGADVSSTRVIRNSSIPQEGTLDATAFPVVTLPNGANGNTPSGSIAVGDLYSVDIGQPGSPGSGGGGTFSTPEYVTCGGDNQGNTLVSPLRYGRGVGADSFTHTDIASAVVAGANGNGGLGLSSGDAVPGPIEIFDPFFDRNQSIVALGENADVALVHNNRLQNSFFNLTHATLLPDEYDLTPCFDPQTLTLPFDWRTLTTGNLNCDLAEDVVYMSSNDDLIFLLGRGKPGNENRILEFKCNEPGHFYFDYGGSGVALRDFIITADLDGDGDDEILISRGAQLSTGGHALIVIPNLTMP